MKVNIRLVTKKSLICQIMICPDFIFSYSSFMSCIKCDLNSDVLPNHTVFKIYFNVSEMS